MGEIRDLIIENLVIFNEVFPNRFYHSQDAISAILQDYHFTHGQVKHEIEKMVHEGVIDAELSDGYEIKLS
jgi:hypothetical protein